jgi:hypothetical protein
MLKRVQHDEKKVSHSEPGPEPCPETSSGSNEFRIYRFRNLEFGNDSISIVFVLAPKESLKKVVRLKRRGEIRGQEMT